MKEKAKEELKSDQLSHKQYIKMTEHQVETEKSDRRKNETRLETGQSTRQVKSKE